jgi:hypothetical protein
MNGRRLFPRLIPSPGSLVALLALGVALGPGVPAMFRADGDVGRHIRMGRQILEQGRIPATDSLSHTLPGGEWIPKEWASQVAMATADMNAGLAGVATLAALVFAVTVGLVYAIGRAGGAGILTSLLVATISLLLQLSTHLLPRPHLVTTALLAAVTLVLVRYRQTRRRWLMLPLPLLFAAWANLHGGFPVGFVILGVFVVDGVVDSLRGRVDWRATGLVAVTALTAAAATLLNPVGIELWRHVAGHVANQFFMDITREFQSPDFHQAYARLFLAVVLGTLALLAATKPHVRLHEAALYMIGLSAALGSARHITVFSVISVPWIAVWMTRALRDAAADGAPLAIRFIGTGARVEATAALTGIVSPILIGMVAVALTVGPLRHRAAFDPTQFPVAALESVTPGSLPPEMFNQMRWGGYLLYAYPEVRIFMDGHADFFGEELTREYLAIRHLAPGWQELLDRFAVRWTLTMPEGPITQALYLSPDWIPLYADDVAVVFERDDS